jgi:hypothetical protein
VLTLLEPVFFYSVLDSFVLSIIHVMKRTFSISHLAGVMKRSFSVPQLVGIALLIASAVPYLILPLLPMMSLSNMDIVTWSVVLVVVSEIFSTIAILLLGKKVYQVIKQRVFGWFSQVFTTKKPPSQT